MVPLTADFKGSNHLLIMSSSHSKWLPVSGSPLTAVRSSASIFFPFSSFFFVFMRSLALLTLCTSVMKKAFFFFLTCVYTKEHQEAVGRPRDLEVER